MSRDDISNQTGALRSEEGGGGDEKVAQKVIQRSFNLLRDHFNSLTFV